MYTASELKQMALEAGFAGVEFYGDVAGGPLSRDSRLLLVAKAPLGDANSTSGSLDRLSA